MGKYIRYTAEARFRVGIFKNDEPVIEYKAVPKGIGIQNECQYKQQPASGCQPRYSIPGSSGDNLPGFGI